MEPSRRAGVPTSEWIDWARLALVTFAMIATKLGLFQPMPEFNLLGFLAAGFAGCPLVLNALEQLIARRVTIDLFLATALVIELARREVVAALLIVFLAVVWDLWKDR